jgi:RNA polymerase sigma-70 factor (ECF subfamily)
LKRDVPNGVNGRSRVAGGEVSNLYQRRYASVMSYALRRVEGDSYRATDLVADIFIVAWRRLDDIPLHQMICRGST